MASFYVYKKLTSVVCMKYSQVGADNLYKLDLKLREIKANIRTGDGEKPFGNIAVFFLGDIMQLRPVRSEFHIF